MESNLKDKLQKEIMIKTLNFTKKRISKDITTKHNDNFIEASLKKLSDNKFLKKGMAVHTSLSRSDIENITSNYNIWKSNFLPGN